MNTMTNMWLGVGLATLIIGCVMGFYIWSNNNTENREEVENATQVTAEAELNFSGTENPVKAVEDVNPAKKTNPFKDSYQNPFSN